MWGSFQQLSDKNQAVLHDILEDAAKRARGVARLRSGYRNRERRLVARQHNGKAVSGSLGAERDVASADLGDVGCSAARGQ